MRSIERACTDIVSPRVGNASPCPPVPSGCPRDGDHGGPLMPGITNNFEASLTNHSFMGEPALAHCRNDQSKVPSRWLTSFRPETVGSSSAVLGWRVVVLAESFRAEAATAVARTLEPWGCAQTLPTPGRARKAKATYRDQPLWRDLHAPRARDGRRFDKRTDGFGWFSTRGRKVMAENDNPQPQAPQQQGRKWPWRKGKQLGLNPAPSGEQAVVEPIVPAEEPIVLQDGVQPGPAPVLDGGLPAEPALVLDSGLQPGPAPVVDGAQQPTQPPVRQFFPVDPRGVELQQKGAERLAALKGQWAAERAGGQQSGPADARLTREASATSARRSGPESSRPRPRLAAARR